jgi:uncharacterized protein YndB with AHSA1/START domain
VVKDPVIVMSRIFDAPRDLVWQVCTEPKHIVHWWGGQGFSNPACEMDLRPGGAWLHVMRTSDGSELTFNFVFLEVEPPERLVWRPAETHAGGPPFVTQTMTFEDLGDQRTRWTLVARTNSFADRDSAQLHRVASLAMTFGSTTGSLWRSHLAPQPPPAAPPAIVSR